MAEMETLKDISKGCAGCRAVIASGLNHLPIFPDALVADNTLRDIKECPGWTCPLACQHLVLEAAPCKQGRLVKVIAVCFLVK